MRPEKHEEVLQEVTDEIEAALNDARGPVSHQRRLAFSLSLGAVNLIELYLHKINIIKEGSKIDHRWFKKKEESVLEQLQRQVVAPIDSFDKIKQAVVLARKIEEKRDDLAYGAPATELVLQEKINMFLELKKVLQ